MAKPRLTHTAALPEPAHYLPWLRQRDLLAPGLFRFGHDFGNGVVDAQVFQLDEHYNDYRDNLLEARKQLDRFYCKLQLPPETEQATTDFIIERLCHEHAEYFQRQDNKLHCRLSNETLSLDENPDGYLDLIDALASQVQEDIAVLQFDSQGMNTLRALHLCCPNHWGANQRIGQNFFELHKDVPGFNQANKEADKLLRGIVQRGPYVRFVWGLSNNQKLNQHPETQQANRRFDKDGKLYVRVERQLLYGLPSVNALLFFIRTYFVDANILEASERQSLLENVREMNTDMLRYKGIFESRDMILRQLEEKH